MTIKYKKYAGHITLDQKARLFHGEIVNLNSIITFAGRSNR